MGTIDKARGRSLALLRIVLGSGFLYAGLAKALDFEGSGKAFSAAGFLKFGTTGTAPGAAEGAIVNPTHDFWVALAGNAALMPLVDFLVVFGQIAIGAALILGLATRFAAMCGVLMMSLLFVASWDFLHGPVNQLMLYIVATAAVGYGAAGEVFGLDGIVERMSFVKRTPQLRYVLG
jgi:thiosulfate dehydrogenase [quinone] large subunit